MKTEFLLTSLKRAYEPMQELVDRFNSPSGLNINEKYSICDKLNKCYYQIHPILCSYCDSLIKEVQEETNVKEKLIDEYLASLVYLKLYLSCDYTKTSFVDFYLMLKMSLDNKTDFDFWLKVFSGSYNYDLSLWKDNTIYKNALSLLKKENIPKELKNTIYIVLKNQREKVLTNNSSFLKVYNPSEKNKG